MIVFADKPETALARAYRKLSEASAAGAAARDAARDAADAARDAADAADAARDAAWAAADAARDAAWAAARDAEGAAAGAAADAARVALDAARDAARDAADAVDAVWDAARDADFYDAISQAAAWVDEFERLWPVPFYRECCYRAGKEACQFVEWIHHDGTSAVMCEACWYSRLDEIEIDKPEDEREERLRRIVVA